MVVVAIIPINDQKNNSDSCVPNIVTDDETGLLTPKKRDFLCGKDQDDSQSSIRSKRKRIRDCVRNSFDDFGLLVKRLDPGDRRQIFENLQPAPLREKLEFKDTVLRTKELTGLSYPIEFIYTGVRDLDISFEELIAFAVARVEARKRPIGALGSVEVSIDINEKPEADIEEILEKISNEQKLTQVEYETLSRLFFWDEDRFIERLTNLPIAINDIEDDTNLSMGKSLVMLAHMMENPEELFDEDLARRLDDRLIHYFGLDSFLNFDTIEEDVKQPSELTDEIAEDL